MDDVVLLEWPFLGNVANLLACSLRWSSAVPLLQSEPQFPTAFTSQSNWLLWGCSWCFQCWYLKKRSWTFSLKQRVYQNDSAEAMYLQMVSCREYHLYLLFRTICTCLCTLFLLPGYSERVKLHGSISVGKLALSYGIVSLSSWMT